MEGDGNVNDRCSNLATIFTVAGVGRVILAIDIIATLSQRRGCIKYEVQALKVFLYFYFTPSALAYLLRVKL